MLFTSLEFVILFLPAVLLVYCLLPFQYGLKNLWLLAASIAFYAWGEPKFVFAMLASVVFNWFLALFVRQRAPVLWCAVAGNVALLFVYKYLNFVTGGWTQIVLPIGISFFTFQAISYVVDVYRGLPAQKNPLKVALYISLFPQLIAGPIVRYATVAAQIEDRRMTRDLFTDGVYRFLLGFNKKVLLANVFAETADRAFSLAAPDAGLAWLGAIGYMFQIFYDFSGYSDMAVGLGKMFGFTFPENFNYPYIARSASEFWRRWHMSLGSWFRDYVYFPMGGSRVDSRWVLVWNLAVVWLLTGIWHGANWTFIVWGAMWGVLIIGEKLCSRGLSWPLTMLFALVGWVVFRSADLAQAGAYLSAMCGANGWSSPMTGFEWRESAIALVAGILFATPLLHRLAGTVSGFAFQTLLFLLSLSQLAMAAHNPFIYFNF